MSNFNTAYDDVFRTLLVDCRKLIIPVVNAMITRRLDQLVRSCVINEYVKKTICEMSERVITKIAAKYESIRKEVTSIMGGKVLEYEAKDILRKGIKEGIEVGTKTGKLEALCELVKDGLLSIEEAAKRAGMTVENFQEELQKTNV